MDFVSDALADGRALRCLTIVDDFTRESPAIEVGHSLPAWRRIHVLERVAAERGSPASIVCDNGPEFASKALDLWAHDHGVALQFIRPGKPVENAYVESFNGKFRNECLNSHWFRTLTEAQHEIACWHVAYNEVRPHKNLGRRTPRSLRGHCYSRHHPNDSLPEWLRIGEDVRRAGHCRDLPAATAVSRRSPNALGEMWHHD